MTSIHSSREFLNALMPSKYPDIHLYTSDRDGQVIEGHKMILASCSEKFDRLFCKNNKSFLLVRNVRFTILKKVVEMIYHGKILLENPVDLEDFMDAFYMFQLDKKLTLKSHSDPEEKQVG